MIVVLGSFEHEMFEQVCEACATWDFVLRSDVVPDADGNDGAAAIFVDDDVEAV